MSVGIAKLCWRFTSSLVRLSFFLSFLSFLLSFFLSLFLCFFVSLDSSGFPSHSNYQIFFKSASTSPRSSREWAVTLDPEQHVQRAWAWKFHAYNLIVFTSILHAEYFGNKFTEFQSDSHGLPLSNFPTPNDWTHTPNQAGWMGYLIQWTQVSLKIGFPVIGTIPSVMQAQVMIVSWITYQIYRGMGLPSKRYRTWHVALLQCCLSKPGGLEGQMRLGWNYTGNLGGWRQKLGYPTTKMHSKLVSFWTVWSCGVQFFSRFCVCVCHRIYLTLAPISGVKPSNWMRQQIWDRAFSGRTHSRASWCCFPLVTAASSSVKLDARKVPSLKNLGEFRAPAGKEMKGLTIPSGWNVIHLDVPNHGKLRILIWCSPLHLPFEQWHMHLQTWPLTSTRMGSPQPMDQKAWLRWHGAARTFRGLLLIWLIQ